MTQIADTGSVCGYVVTLIGIERDAQKRAAAHDIVDVTLDANATSEEFVLKFLNSVFVDFREHIAHAEGGRADSTVAVTLEGVQASTAAGKLLS